MGQTSNPRRGSETRQKQRIIGFRVSPEERAEIEAAALGAGLTLGSYVREKTLTERHTRSRRRPSVEVQAVTRLQGELNRIGGNIHQILRRVNFGETPSADEFRGALTGYREAIAAIMDTLGRGRR